MSRQIKVDPVASAEALSDLEGQRDRLERVASMFRTAGDKQISKADGAAAEAARTALFSISEEARSLARCSRSHSFLLKSAVLMMQGEDGRAAARMRGAGGV